MQVMKCQKQNLNYYLGPRIRIELGYTPTIHSTHPRKHEQPNRICHRGQLSVTLHIDMGKCYVLMMD